MFDKFDATFEWIMENILYRLIQVMLLVIVSMIIILPIYFFMHTSSSVETITLNKEQWECAEKSSRIVEYCSKGGCRLVPEDVCSIYKRK